MLYVCAHPANSAEAKDEFWFTGHPTDAASLQRIAVAYLEVKAEQGTHSCLAAGSRLVYAPP